MKIRRSSDAKFDHIIAEKHGGPTKADNLAYACLSCNRHKGTDLTSILANGELVRFFKIRIDEWVDHFHFAPDGIRIEAKTPIGEVTARIFGFNSPEQLIERKALFETSLYPSPNARRRARVE